MNPLDKGKILYPGNCPRCGVKLRFRQVDKGQWEFEAEADQVEQSPGKDDAVPDEGGDQNAVQTDDANGAADAGKGQAESPGDNPSGEGDSDQGGGEGETDPFEDLYQDW